MRKTSSLFGCLSLGTLECWGGRQGGCGLELCVRQLRVCGSQLAVCLVSLFVSVCRSCVSSSSVQRPPIPRWCPVRAWLFFTFLPTYLAAHHTPLVAVLQSAARARCTGPTCGRRHVRRGSPRGSAPTTSNAPPWHRGADDQAQRMTPGKRSRASTIAAGRRAAPNHGGRAAAARNLRHNANRARPSTGKHTPRLGHSVPRARERGWLLAREESFRDPLQDHARIIPRPGGRRDCNQSSRAACRSLGRLGRRGGEQGTQL